MLNEYVFFIKVIKSTYLSDMVHLYRRTFIFIDSDDKKLDNKENYT